MFGHRDDITAQDRKTDVTVQLPDDAIAALTSASDNQQSDQPHTEDEHTPNEQQAAPSRPASQSIDGVSPAPQTTGPAQLPSSYLEFLGAPGGTLPTALTPEPPRQTTEPAPQVELVAEEFGADFSPEEQAAPVINTDKPSHSDQDLNYIKQAALAELSPLVDQLEQTPEERFKTLMMLIQASDNQALISEAHHAARQIRDEKLRAEALLQVVNEINYFTRQANLT